MSNDQNPTDERPQAQMSREEIVKKLSSEAMEADWNMLKSHYQRGAVIVISKDLDLFEAGASIAMDEAKQLESWMKEQLVYQATPQEAKAWEENPYKKSFQFVVVQPYVLVQQA